jgi:hypothetical protein
MVACPNRRAEGTTIQNPVSEEGQRNIDLWTG